jgi:hypothetical protein
MKLTEIKIEESKDIEFDNTTATHPIIKDNDIDYFEEIAFHPSLDIKNDTLVLGFRVKPEVDRETTLFVSVTIDKKVTVKTMSHPSFEVNGKKYAIDLKKRKLAILSHKWNRKDFNEFVEKLTVDDYRKLIEPNAVFVKVRNALKQHMDLHEADITLMSVWAIGTYFFPIFSAFPYLHIKAPKGSGKTQGLSFLQQTCFNAVKARASLPALRDTVDALRGTYLIDQADALYRPNMDEIRDILTDSYKRSGGNTRKMSQDKGKNWNVEEFQAYSPKAFASIKDMPEDLRDRCVVISPLRSRKVFRPLDEEDAMWKDIRADEYKLLLSCFKDVATEYEVKKVNHQYNDPKSVLTGRRLELWLLFEVMLSFLGVSEADQGAAKDRFLSRYPFAEYETTELELAVIEAVKKCLDGKDEAVLKPKNIATTVDDVDLFDQESFGGKQMSEKQRAAKVGRIIKKFNLSSEKLARSNEGERYRFKKAEVEGVYQAYFISNISGEHTPSYTPKDKPDSLASLADDGVHDTTPVQDEHT